MRWFFEQAFALLFPDHMPKSGSEREYFVTLGICYIAEQQKFIPPIPETPLRKSNRAHEIKEKYEYTAFEYCRSRFGYLLSVHEENNGVVKDERYTVSYQGKTYEESKHVILTAVYALKLLDDFCASSDKSEWIPAWKIDIPTLQKCSMIDVMVLSDEHEKKFRMALVLTCMQLAAKIISDDSLTNDKELAEVFSLTPAEFSNLQLKVLDGLNWYLNRTNEQLLAYADKHQLPERVSLCIAEHEDVLNSFWIYPEDERKRTPLVKVRDLSLAPPPSPETKTIAAPGLKDRFVESLHSVISKLDGTIAPVHFSRKNRDRHCDSGFSAESPTIQELTPNERTKVKKYIPSAWD